MKKYLSAFIVVLMTFFVAISSAHALDYLSFRFPYSKWGDTDYANYILNNYGNVGWKYISTTSYSSVVKFPHLSNPDRDNFGGDVMYFEYDGHYHHYQTITIDNPDEVSYWLNFYGENGWEYISAGGLGQYTFEYTGQPVGYYVISFDSYTSIEDLRHALTVFGQVGLRYISQYVYNDSSTSKWRYLSIFKQVGRTVVPAQEFPLWVDLQVISRIAAEGNRCLGVIELPEGILSSGGQPTRASVPVFESVGYPVEYIVAPLVMNRDIGDEEHVLQWSTDDLQLVSTGRFGYGARVFERIR